MEEIRSGSRGRSRSPRGRSPPRGRSRSPPRPTAAKPTAAIVPDPDYLAAPVASSPATGQPMYADAQAYASTEPSYAALFWPCALGLAGLAVALLQGLSVARRPRG